MRTEKGNHFKRDGLGLVMVEQEEVSGSAGCEGSTNEDVTVVNVSG